MKKLRNISKHFYLILLAILFISHQHIGASEKGESINSLFNLSKDLQYVYPDSAIRNFQTCLAYYEEVADTNMIIETRLFLLGKYSGMGRYQLAYDYAWSLMPIVEAEGYSKQKVEVFSSIAILYTIFEQYEKAFLYLDKSINNAKNLDLDEAEKSSILCELTSAKAWLVTESEGDLKLAEKLRLTSIEYGKSSLNEPNVRFQRMHLAKLYVEMNRLEEASKILKEIERKVSATNLYPIHSLLYDYLGHLYLKYHRTDSAILYFEKSIEAIEFHKNHLDLEVGILEILSELYAQKGEYSISLEYLRKAKQLDDSMFGSRSSQNKVLFEIKDKHAIQLKHKEEEIKNQRLVILERDRELWILRSILFVFGFSIIIIILVARYKWILRKQKIKQEIIRKKEELEHQKQVEIIDLKNKELMTSALKLIERDTLLDDIRKILQELNVKPENRQSIKKITQSIVFDRSKKWEEFELYFNTVNSSFYEALRSEFSNLTKTDLKMCALIILGFSSKDMAQIMSSGVDGINTSRSRIRKKLGLSRDMNLVEFLQNYATTVEIA